jgi:hypothetical protein
MANSRNKLILLSIVILLLILVFPFDSAAQCPACRAAVESNMKDGGEKVVGTGLNKGILVLLSAPYLLIGGLLIVWRKKSKVKNDEQPS